MNDAKPPKLTPHHDNPGELDKRICALEVELQRQKAALVELTEQTIAALDRAIARKP